MVTGNIESNKVIRQKLPPFTLPAIYWVDGSYILSFEADMSDGYVTSNRASSILDSGTAPCTGE